MQLHVTECDSIGIVREVFRYVRFVCFTVAREKQSAVWMAQLETIKRLEHVVNEDQTEGSKLRAALMELQHENAK